MANGNPYLSLYAQVYDDMLDCMSTVEKNVLIALVRHAGEYGSCYPGLKRIVERSHHSMKSVERALARLGEMGYVRYLDEVSAIDPKSFKRWWIICPNKIALRPECEEHAWRLWASASPYVINALRNDPQPPPITTNRSTSRTTSNGAPPLSTSTTTTKTNDSSNGGVSHEADAEPELAGQNAQMQEQGQNQNPDPVGTPPAPTGATPPSGDAATYSPNPPPPSPRRGKVRELPPPHPPLPDGFVADVPMADQYDEGAAVRLKNLMPAQITLPNARKYIARYNRQLVMAAADSVAHDRSVDNPVAVMDYRLRQGLIDPARDSDVNWNALFRKLFEVNYNDERTQVGDHVPYEYLLKRDDCPCWFRALFGQGGDECADIDDTPTYAQLLYQGRGMRSEEASV